jgi:hypothetical protein
VQKKRERYKFRCVVRGRKKLGQVCRPAAVRGLGN